MPKTSGTRVQTAEQLLERIKRGPAFSDPSIFGGGPMTAEEAARQYKLWVNSWIIADLVHLVPELKHRKEVE